MVTDAGTIQYGRKQGRAWSIAATVPDPELPFISIGELGILRDVEVDGNLAVAKIAPTYFGCPALVAIELAVAEALERSGFRVRIERVIEPPWTTDWISDSGRSKLLAHGIAPPAGSDAPLCGLFEAFLPECPNCGNGDTQRISEFGATPCKALYRCRACAEPFEYFKKL